MYYLDKIKSHLLNWWEYIKEHFVRIIVILIIVAICLYYFTLFPKNNIAIDNVINEQHIIIFGITLENWFTWFSLVGLILTSIWAIYQFDKNIVLKQQEKASEIAKSFSDKLTIKCSIICGVINNSELFHLLELKSKKYNDFKVFNTNEIRSIYNDDNFIEKYKKTKSECDLDSIYYRLLESLISDKSFKNLMKETCLF